MARQCKAIVGVLGAFDVMAIPVIIGSLEFKTKKAAKEHFRSMLSRYSDHETINDFDYVELEHLLERHPESEQKFGSGVKRFFKAPTDQGTSCFWVEKDRFNDH